MNEVALLFPGQGSQYVGMGQAFYNDFSIARRTFEEASDVLGMNMAKLCFEGDINELTKTENAQPAIMTCSVASYLVFQECLNLIPKCYAGHSLGEYTALVCAGYIDFRDGLKIVNSRGKYMQESVLGNEGAMYAIYDIDFDTIRNECNAFLEKDLVVEISNYNAPNQVVISGHTDAVREVGNSLKSKGAKVMPLRVSAPFHCSLMSTAAQKMEKELNKYKFNSSSSYVLSNASALPYLSEKEIINNLTKQMTAPVLWHDCMKFIVSLGINQAIELGPKKVLKNLTEKSGLNIEVHSCECSDDIQSLIEKTGEKSADYTDITKYRLSIIERCLAAAVCSKNYKYNSEEYSNNVVRPYKKLKGLYEHFEKNMEQLDEKKVLQAVEILHSILKNKGLCEEEKSSWLKDVIRNEERLYLSKELRTRYEELINMTR
ncbi:MAG: ACP S-malonyltransferase [Bacillota bacterium]